MVGVIQESISCPVTTLLILLNTGLYLYQWNKKIAPESLAVSLKQVVDDGEYWRLVTAGFTHGSAMHLLFNMASLWNMKFIESKALGSLEYLRDSIAILFVSKALMMLLHYLASRKFGFSRFDSMMSVGYSGVIFAWMTVTAMWNPSGEINVFGSFNIPTTLAPFGSLLFTQLIVPRASFTGHLAGIFAGFIASFGAFSWLNWYWMTALVATVGAVALVSAVATTSVNVPGISVDREMWNRSSLSDFVVPRTEPPRTRQTDWGTGPSGRPLSMDSSSLYAQSGAGANAPRMDQIERQYEPYRDNPQE
eukprot:gb/GECG01007637.1/.p1 GENE.gb/GECG01007637.1/~~gb/GECG01007637.1/.p1  ORF type:complete len:307 (+),score=17.16 gb/GECG01007637.1/:1-921(+)